MLLEHAGELSVKDAQPLGQREASLREGQPVVDVHKPRRRPLDDAVTRRHGAGVEPHHT